eukprot:CAMPEP_0168472500 /NCGR_PEP_ID=MMETSP0228-20121227/59832_1 /TAXON_ID=133427 /ORGANISM="Protoceratium reticulatum, Strain CCCM 535 (=CCMP 1889)" /LENGTH=67 /DNA_ID=CAMNT_0008488447 /DNA_START=43 /DNA_END=246 /DNA_ORIENTATION=+
MAASRRAVASHSRCANAASASRLSSTALCPSAAVAAAEAPGGTDVPAPSSTLSRLMVRSHFARAEAA